MKKLQLILLPFFVLMFFSACSQTSSMNIEPGYKFKITNFTVGTIKDISVSKSKIHKKALLKNALIKELETQNLLSIVDNIDTIVLDLTITKYAEGNAFKRWLMPGWGGTALTVKTEMKKNQKIIATSIVEHTVSMGGGYTIGADKYIFKDVAKNIVEDIMKQN